MSDFEIATSSSKSFCEYEPVKLLPEVEIFPNEAALIFFRLLGSGRFEAFA